MVVGVLPTSSSPVFPNGVKGCTDVEYRSHMSLWCLMASPLLAGNDIRNMSEATRDILLNSEIIAINQDVLGKQAKRIRDDGDYEVIAKPLADGSVVVGLLNRNDSIEKEITVSWKEIGIEGKREARDVWAHLDLGGFSESYTKSVKPLQCIVVRLYKK